MKSSSKALLAALLSAAALATLRWLPDEPALAETGKRTPLAAGVGAEQAPSPAPVAAPAGEAATFADIGALEKGSIIPLPLPDGGTKQGRINYVNRYPNGACAAGGRLADSGDIFEIAEEPWGYRGFVLQKKEKIAYVYSSDAAGKLQVARKPIGDVICEPDPNFKPLAQTDLPDPEKAAIYNGGRSVGIIGDAIPILSSLPRAEATIYLDFDGEVIEGHSWEGGARIVAPAYNLPASEVTDMWRRVAEDFSPFEVNVTTDLQAYLRAPQGRRIRCITTTNNFASAGGVAFNNTFMESGEPVCWNFYRGNGGAVVISHEVGHSFGLSHDGTNTSGYFGGYGSGNMSWGPIMGAPYGQNICQWSKGDYPNANEQQDDLNIIGASAPRRMDEHAAFTALATPLTLGSGGSVSNSGVIESPDDIDTFIFTTGGGNLSLTFTPAQGSPNLDIEAKLYDGSGTLVSTTSPANQLNAVLGAVVGAGTYTVTVDGVGNGTWASEGYDDFGSMGQYTITGSVPSPSWRFQVAANSLNGTVVGTVAPGGSAYSITGGNTGTAFAINSATGLLTVANAASLSSGGTFNLTIAHGGGQTTTVPVKIAPLRGLKQEIWTGLGGNGIGPLTSLPAYPNSPNIVRHAPNLQTTYPLDNYGQKLSGYLLPVESGSYTFWTKSDDASEVWLSTDSNPANKTLLCSANGSTGPDNWAAQGSQQSAVKTLVAGQRYYIEVLLRDQTGPDHLAVAWQTPTLSRRIITSDFLEYPGSMPNRAPWLASMTFRVREDSTTGTVVGTLAAGDFEPGPEPSNFAITGGNTGNAFALNASTGALTVNAALSFATLQKYLLDVQVSDSGGLTKSAQIAVEVEPRAVKRELWTGITGNQISNLTSSPNYQNPPNSTTYQAFFETPSNIAENYGQRLSGYLRAPDSGSYTFWIASDDAGELWLSSDHTPANKTRIAWHTGATGSREWGKYSTQRSAAITLEGGKFYYVEVLHKEGAVSDNLAVSWQGPGFDQVILGAPHVTQNFYNHAAPVLNDKTVTVSDRDTAVTSLEAKDWSDPGTTVRYSITAGNDDGAFTIDPLTGTIRASGNLPRLPAGNRVLTVTATDNGITPLSDTATITVQVQKAVLKREVWTGLPGGQGLGDLTGWLYFPQSPDETGYEDRFKAPTGWGENYGQRLSGYLIPSTTGNYTFWIASDDGGQLFLSSDTNPANKKAIASVTGSVGEEQWTTQGSQQSAVIPLLAGQRYYIEALQKEGNGGDHLAVAWQGPGFTRTVIPGANLEYPDELRPTLRREIWTSTNAVAWAKNPATNLMDWATTILAEAFESTGALSGNATETGTATWGASTAWTRNNNVANKSGTGYATALLPFTPIAGKVYTLSLEMDPTNSPGSTDWFALGFLTQPATNTALYTQNSVFETHGSPWMLVRANGNSGGNTIQAFSSALNNVINSAPAISGPGTYDTIAVTLDTRGANWISRYHVNGSLRGTHTLTPNPAIQSAGFGAFSNAVGNVRNFRIASNDAPAATSRDHEGTLMSFKAPIDTFENFTQRLSGFIVPPATGAYTFWLATDDDGELLLSTDENPANLAKIASVTGHVNPEAWDVGASQKSAVKNLVAGKRYYVEVRHRDGVFGDHAAVAWEGPGFTRQIVANQYLEHPSAPADRSLLKREVWTGITGNNVGDLTGNAAFPATPNSTGTLATGAGFKVDANVAETFGERLSGFLVAPETGRFTFWISADDNAELWLSTSDNPANRIRIANVSGATGNQAFDTQASQKSVPVALVAGRRYYIEGLHKEGIGGDHLAVAWQGPSFVRRVIPNQYLEHPLSIPGTPSLKREVWTGMTGEQVSILTSNPAFAAGTPNERGVLTAFEAPIDQADNYGQKICAKLTAPESGNYKFWIASDDASELWLSTNADPANRIKIASTNAFTNPREWTKYPTQESGALTLMAGTTYYIEALQKDGGGGDHLAVAWQGPSFPRQIIDGRFLQFHGSLPEPLALKREIWTGINGEQVSNLTGLGSYPDSPNQTLTLDEFEAPQNWGNNYGQKISGYLIAPRGGDYKFWIASDDGGDLNLATDGNPANKTRIAYTTNATGYRNWTNNANQTSATIALTAGQRCYIEALQKEGGGDDYVSVSWQGPGFGQQIIRGEFLDYPGVLPSPAQPPVPAVPNAPDPGYAFWLDANGLTGGNRAVNADPDGDQLSNSLEFVLGGKPAGVDGNSSALWPQATVDANWVNFVYRRADVSIPAGPFVQYGEIPGVWTRAENGVGGVQITTEDDGFGPGIDRVTVRVPRGDKSTLFVRLNVSM